MMGGGFFGRMRTLDAYPKTMTEFQKKTFGGAAISILSGVFIIFLVISEFRHYTTVESIDKLSVDVAMGETLQINVDFTFPHLSCNLLSLDVMDISGEQHLDVSHNVFKKRIDANGNALGEAEPHDLHGKEGGKPEVFRDKEGKVIDLKNAKNKHLEPGYCGSCYGAAEKGKCCNTCDDVREAYRIKGWAFTDPDGIEQCKREGFVQELQKMGTEGCNVFGSVEVNKVAGNFHFAPGKSFQQAHMHVHDLMNFNVNAFNVSHTINSMSFGSPYPGIVNPLDNTVRTVGVDDIPSSGMF